MTETMDGSESQPESQPSENEPGEQETKEEIDNREELRNLRMKQYREGLSPEEIARRDELDQMLNNPRILTEEEQREFQNLIQRQSDGLDIDEESRLAKLQRRAYARRPN